MTSIDTSTTEGTYLDLLNSYRPKKELEFLIKKTLKEKKVNPNSLKIDELIPEQVLHKYNPTHVLDYAVKMGFLISRCMGPDKEQKCTKPVRANGVWLEEPDEYKVAFMFSRKISHGYCPDCFDKMLLHLGKTKRTYPQEPAKKIDMPKESYKQIQIYQN